MAEKRTFFGAQFGGPEKIDLFWASKKSLAKDAYMGSHWDVVFC